MGRVMQELVYSLNYVLEHGFNEELGRHRSREGKCMCNLWGEDCESVGHFVGLPVFFRAPCIIFRASEKEFRGRI